LTGGRQKKEKQPLKHQEKGRISNNQARKKREQRKEIKLRDPSRKAVPPRQQVRKDVGRHANLGPRSPTAKKNRRSFGKEDFLPKKCDASFCPLEGRGKMRRK